jgi:16S rRNA (guanine527-N7)-methyltransferase
VAPSQPDGNPPSPVLSSTDSALDRLLRHRLRNGAAALGVPLDARQIDQLREYLHLLLEWNQRFNLTAIAAPEEVIDKHFLDSLSCALALDLAAVKRVVDVGTGAGFPGLVLRIAFPHLEVLLLDSVDKRLRFLQRVTEALGLTGVETAHARAEDAGRDPRWRGRFDLATARAVARLNTLAEYCLPLVRSGGWFLAQKGPDVHDELAEARTALKALGGGEPSVKTFTLPGTSIGRSLVLVPKERPTPREYPRLAGTPKKHPIK